MIGAHIHVILIVTGILTAGTFPLFFAPATALRMIFGTAPNDERRAVQQLKG